MTSAEMQGFLIVEDFFEKISNFLYFFRIQTPISIETSKQHVRHMDANKQRRLVMQVKETIKELQGSIQNSETREKIRKLIPKLAQKVMKDLERRGEIDLTSISIDGLPAGLNALVVSSTVATDVYADYDKKEDGDLADYLEWTIESVLRMMNREFKTGMVKENYVIKNLSNFYKKISATMDRTGDFKKTAEVLGIPMNERMIEKVAEICDERVL